MRNKLLLVLCIVISLTCITANVQAQVGIGGETDPNADALLNRDLIGDNSDDKNKDDSGGDASFDRDLIGDNSDDKIKDGPDGDSLYERDPAGGDLNGDDPDAQLKDEQEEYYNRMNNSANRPKYAGFTDNVGHTACVIYARAHFSMEQNAISLLLVAEDMLRLIEKYSENREVTRTQLGYDPVRVDPEFQKLYESFLCYQETMNIDNGDCKGDIDCTIARVSQTARELGNIRRPITKYPPDPDYVEEFDEGDEEENIEE